MNPFQIDQRQIQALTTFLPLLLTILMAVVPTMAGSKNMSSKETSSVVSETLSSAYGIKPAKITQADLAQATNDWRVKNGAPALQTDDYLNQVAQEWAEYMAANHNLVHRNPLPRFTKDGVTYLVSENISMSSAARSAESVVQSWHNSTKGHSENQMSSRHRYIGVGVAYASDGSMWAVQNFASPSQN